MENLDTVSCSETPRQQRDQRIDHNNKLRSTQSSSSSTKRTKKRLPEEDGHDDASILLLLLLSVLRSMRPTDSLEVRLWRIEHQIDNVLRQHVRPAHRSYDAHLREPARWPRRWVYYSRWDLYIQQQSSIKGETEREYVEKKELLSLACWAEVGWQCCGVVVACCGCYSEYNTTLRAGSCPLPFLPINCTRSRFVVLSSWCV